MLCDVAYALHVEHIERAPFHTQQERRERFEAALHDEPARGLSPEQLELRRELGVA